MFVNMQTLFLKLISQVGKFRPMDSKPVLVQVMASCRVADKPVPKLLSTQFIEPYMRHHA